MARICAHCGTEVDDEALFCPTCGEPIDTSAQPQLPPAPDWPELPPRQAGTADAPAPGVEAPETAEPEASEGAAPEAAASRGEPEAAPEPPAPERAEREPEAADAAEGEPAAAEPEPYALPPALRATEEPPAATHGWSPPGGASQVPPWRRGAMQRIAAERAAEAEPQPAPAVAPAAEPASTDAAPEPPVTRATSTAGARPGAPRPQGIVHVPTLLSEWLAGIGALVAVAAMFLPWRLGGPYTAEWGFASGINVLAVLVLLAVLAAVFLPHYLPAVPRRGLILLGIGCAGMGIGLDRFGLPVTGAGASLFLIASLAIAGGALVSELGVDREVGGPQA